MKDKTVCVKCEHCFISYGPGAVIEKYLCKKSEKREKVIDYVVGNYAEYNYSECKDVNTNGNCKLFSPREIGLKGLFKRRKK